MTTDQPVDIAAIITAVLSEARKPAEQAALILKTLDAHGVEVIAPQDLVWGVCPEDTDGGPHYVSTNLCSGCLQYDPD